MNKELVRIFDDLEAGEACVYGVNEAIAKIELYITKRELLARYDEWRRVDEADDSKILLTTAGLRYMVSRLSVLTSNNVDKG